MRLRLLSLPLLATLAACSGSAAPPPPVASAPPSPATDELRPLSSRDRAPGLPAEIPPAGSGAPASGPLAAPTLPPGHPPIGPETASSAGASASAGAIAGTIRIAPGLRVGASDVLYVMAKRGSTTLAVRRIASPSFPLSFEISGADAMMAGAGFEGPVDVVARVSRSGDAIPAAGDLEGTVKNVRIPAKGVALTITSVRR